MAAKGKAMGVIFLSHRFSLRIKFPRLSMEEEWCKNEVKHQGFYIICSNLLLL